MKRTGSAEPAGGLASRLARPRIALPLLLALTALARLGVFPAVTAEDVTPDGARFFNIARCIERGQGFSTPEAWPAWMNPAALPMPETFKEPGYPYAIAALTPLAGSPFAAARAVSLLAGLLLPALVFVLARRTGADPATALAAGFLTAASPLLNVLSAVVMAESLFTALLVAAFAAAARPPRAEAGAAHGTALLAGALFGAAFLVRAQALLALPALVLLLAARLPPAAALWRTVLALLAAQLVAAPLLLRNLLRFGAPLHSDAAAFGVWPYVDQVLFSSSLERPPAALPFALAHLEAVAAQVAGSARTFARWTLGGDLLPGRLWLLPLGIGAALLLVRALRPAADGPRWGFAWALLAVSLPFLFAVYWAPRYFAMLAPAFALFAAFGLAALDRALLARRAPRIAGALALLLAFAAVFPGVRIARAQAGALTTPDAGAARAEAEFLRAHLAPGEAVMCDITSYWAWYADRPAVHVVIADEARLRAVLERLRVRWVALPDAKRAAYAARYPGGALPALFVPHHRNAAHGVTVYEVHMDAGPAAPGGAPPAREGGEP